MEETGQDPLRTIAIVEDDEALRADFVRLVEQEPCFTLLSASATLAEANILRAQPADIILIDLMLPDGAAFNLISALSETGRSKLIVISVLGDERAVVSAFRSGAHGYLLKGATGFELREAIYQALSGNAPISPAIARYLIREFRALPAQAGADGRGGVALSKRETDVLNCLAQGATDKETARTLDISPYTVADHLRSIFRKLQVRTRAAAVARAVDAGVVQLGPDPS